MRSVTKPPRTTACGIFNGSQGQRLQKSDLKKNQNFRMPAQNTRKTLSEFESGLISGCQKYHLFEWNTVKERLLGQMRLCMYHTSEE